MLDLSRAARGAVGLGAVQWRFLRWLSGQGPRGGVPYQFAKQGGVPLDRVCNVYRMVRRLEQRSLVRRDADGRVAITELAAEALESSTS